NMGKNIFGTWGGDNDPDKDFPEYIDMFKSGVIDLAPFVTKIYTLEQINQAIDDLDSGKTLRPIIQTTIGLN
ncbi:MAG: alcohol dehydrogenase, partial [Candidatus Marinimicrobia bacterium]|nr:alcohol dehydrogenase [Candidatus Neomarinimicrobiota bacterium]